VSVKHSSLSVFGFAALALAMLPLWGGCEAQRSFAVLDAQARRILPGQVEVETAVARGWLRSRAETRFVVEGHELVFRHTVTHGPLLLGELLKGRAPWPPARALVSTTWRPDAEAADPDDPWLRAHTLLLMDGTAHVSFESAPRTTGDGLVWGGLEGALAAPQPDLASGIMFAPQLEVAAEGSRIALRDLSAEADLRLSSEGVLLGTTSFSIGSLHGTSPFGGVAVEEVRWEQGTQKDAEGDTYQFEWSTAVGSIASDGERFGPGAVQLILRRIDRAALGEALDAARAGSDPTPDSLQRLLKRSPELELVVLELAGPDGVLRASGRVGIDGDDPRLEMGPLLAALALDANAEILVPIRWMHRAIDQVLQTQVLQSGVPSEQQLIEVASLRTAWIRNLVSAGWLLRVGEGYRLRVDYRDGQLLLNGRAFDPSAIQSLQPISH